MNSLINFSLIVTLFLGICNPGSAKEIYRTTDEKRNSAWNIGISGFQHSLKSGDGNNFLGTSTAVELGYTHIDHNWLIMLNLDVISGPYLAPQQQNTKLDYGGTGTTVLLASSAEGADIRSYNGNYGFAIGLHYTDLVGRVVGTRTDSLGKTDSLVMRVTNFAMMPSVFFNWLKPSPRLVSNHPENLNTRIEGYHLNLGFLVPIIANYTIRYDSYENDQFQQIKEKGKLFGFGIIITYTAFLGI